MDHHVTTHTLDWTVVHKCLPVLVPSQVHSCTTYSATAAPQTSFSCTGHL